MLDTHEVTKAVNYLISVRNPTKLIDEMVGILGHWTEHPMAYTGDAACLNALLDVGLADRVAFDKLLHLVADKRATMPEARKRDYQRLLMRERRARVQKAIHLYELRYGKMTRQRRAAYAEGLFERWRGRKETFLAERAKQTPKGKLGWVEKNAATQDFWEMIDRQLDENIREETLKH